MPRFGDLVMETEFKLSRPTVAAAEAWVRPRLSADLTLDRNNFTPKDLVPFISRASLFSLIIDGDTVTDFHIRVLASHVVEDLSELSGTRGSEKLDPALFERWLKIGQFAVDAARPFCARSVVLGNETKLTENLCIPIRANGALDQLLVISEYWYERI